MGPLVCMSLEEMERSVSTERVAALTTHRDCGDVIFLTPVETCRASTSTSVMMEHMVNKECFMNNNYVILELQDNLIGQCQ